MIVRKTIRRMLSAVLLLAILVGTVPVGMIPQAQAAGVTRAQVNSALKSLPALQPVNEEIGMPQAQTDCTEEELQAANDALKSISGKFYIVTASDENGKYYMLHPYLSGGKDDYPNTFPATAVALKDGAIYGADPSLAAELEWCGEDSNSVFPGASQTRRSGITAYHVSFGDGRHLKIYSNGNGIRRNDAPNTTVNLFCYYPNGTFALRCNGNDGYAFRINASDSKYPHFTLADYSEQTTLRLYRVLEDRVNTEPLYNAITEMKSYVSRESQFEESTYEAFLECMYLAIQTYSMYNGVVQPADTDIDKLNEELEILADELSSYAMELEEYIDIALEAYDFRADGFTFEALFTFASPCSLSENSPKIKDEYGVDFSRPGSFGRGDNYTEDSYQFFIEGLTEKKLVNDRIVYTEDTIKYIALSLWRQKDLPSEDSFYPDWNGEFLKLARTFDENDLADLGSYEDTSAKTDTGEWGGVLLWNDVVTAYDLAYYMFHGIWFKAEEIPENVLETKTTRTGETVPVYYNTYIDEFKSMRLLATGDGSYKFTSNSGYNYNAAKGYIYNDFVSRRSSSPTFNIAANLGYESDDMFGIAQTGLYRDVNGKKNGTEDVDTDKFFPNKNYYYAFHASSPFIYREEDNLFFSFVGDDDVYFFINDRLVCDLGGVHGSPSARIEINDLIEKGELDLKDGDICSFDMFFVDRHLTSINVTLETNIKMMDATVETEKTQYDAATGQLLEDGAAVTTGAEIAYGFAMTNRMELGVTELSFNDPSMGILLDGTHATLNGTEEPKNLIVTYTTCDDNTGELCDQEPQVWAFDAFVEKLRKATFDPETTVNPLEEGVYRVRITSGPRLKELLAIGLPANTRIDIYGMKRPTEGGKYTNTLITGCYPLDLNDAKGDLITGTDSCTIYSMDLKDVQVNRSASIVMDYGKPLDVNPALLTEYITYDPDSIELKFVGLRLNDRNGASYPDIPADLGCTTQRPQLMGEEGTFSRRTRYIRYTLNGFMEQIETCYLLYSVEYRSDPGNIKWYVMLELALIPANIMYYEAESLAPSLIQYEEVTKDGTENPQWKIKTDSTLKGNATDLSRWTNPSTEAQDTVILGEEQKQHMSDEFILLSFDEDQDYTSPVYKGNNFSTGEKWSWNSYRNTNIKLEDGKFKGEFQLDKNKYTDYACWFQTTGSYNVLSYHPTENDCFKIRIRLDNIRSTVDSGRIKFGLRYYWDDKSSPSSAEYRTYDVEEFNNKGYVTIEYDLQSTYDTLARNGSIITALRLELKDMDDATPGAANNGSFAIDYIYVGPKEYSYLLDSENLYIDFKEDYANDMHVQMTDSYGVFDSNNAASWVSNTTNTRNRKVDTQEGVLSFEQTETGYQNRNGSTKEDGTKVSASTMWIQTSKSSQSQFPLSYDPAKVEVVQIRFKLNDMVPKYDFSMAEAETTVDKRNEKLPKVYLQYYHTLNKWGDGATNDGSEKILTAAFESYYYDPATMDDQYLTITMYPNSTFKDREKITAFRIYWSNIHSKSETELGTVTLDYLYVGEVEHLPGPVTYGYDSSYNDDKVLSDGSSLFAQGKGVKTKDDQTDYTEVSFDFKGTGFDLVSRTGIDQATIRVEVQNKATGEVVKKLTVNNKGELELYQIPVVSVQNLPYGNYNVTLWVNAPVDSVHDFLDRGNEFYFDALRIYDPIEPGTNTTVQNAYKTEREEHAYIKEVRNILLSAEAFGTVSGTASGAVFVDMKSIENIPKATDANGKEVESDLDITNRYAMTVETYNKVGPKNEVYLDPGQAIAFRLEIPSGIAPMGLDIGAKTINGQEAHMVAALVQPTDTTTGVLTVYNRQERTIRSGTAMYYPLEAEANQMFKEKGIHYCYIVIYNRPTATATAGSRNHILSVTDIKVTYSKAVSGVPEDDVSDPETKKSLKTAEEPACFLVDRNVTKAAQTLVAEYMELPVDETAPTLRHSLNLGSDIALNYLVPKTSMEGYDSFYLNCEIPRFVGEDFTGYKTVTVMPVEKDGYYYFTLEGLTAVHMMDTVIARLYMERDGVIFLSQADEYSIAQYAYAQMNSRGASESLKTLCANLLRYGALAQNYKGHRLENLADCSMTEVQRAWLTDLETVTFGDTNVVNKELSDPAVQWVGKTLTLDSRVSVRYVVDVADGISPEELTLRVRYTDYRGAERTAILSGAEAYGNTAGRYSFVFDKLLASELRADLYAAVYAGETQVSDTLVYSVGTYGGNKTGILGELCKALMAYSDSARSFFVG